MATRTLINATKIQIIESITSNEKMSEAWEALYLDEKMEFLDKITDVLKESFEC